MLRSFYKIFSLLIALVLVQQAFAFSLLGPKESWQIPALGYFDNDIGAPKDLGHEFRLNTPVITYAFDPTFIDFFGPEGVKAVDAAHASSRGHELDRE